MTPLGPHPSFFSSILSKRTRTSRKGLRNESPFSDVDTVRLVTGSRGNSAETHEDNRCIPVDHLSGVRHHDLVSSVLATAFIVITYFPHGSGRGSDPWQHTSLESLHTSTSAIVPPLICGDYIIELAQAPRHAPYCMRNPGPLPNVDVSP